MEQQQIIGRKNELETLERMHNSRKSEFVILYGRRRVGKTFLVNQYFTGRFTFSMTALANSSTQKQLNNFYGSFMAWAPEPVNAEGPSNWFAAFQMLMQHISRLPEGKKVVFFDELPWLDTRGSDFLSALEHFWNSWASQRNDILLISCGSAASWMINKLINNRGGLHNRVTERILLQPFTLAETESFLQSKGAVYDRYQILELYMAMGGVPFYLDNIVTNKSIAQNIDRMFFNPSGILAVEYNNLYRSLFNKYEKHVAIVETLARTSKVMLRQELIEKAKLKSGGSTTAILDELEYSGFIKKYYPFGKTKRDTFYQLIDPFTLFYHAFIHDSKVTGDGAWLSQMDSPKWRAWSGYAFEFLCMYHIQGIKKQLGISGVYTEVSSWRSTKSSNGAQIDLLIDRNDRIINLCEIKSTKAPYAISHTDADNIANKIAVFREETGTQKTIFMTMITTFGLKRNEYSLRHVQCDLDMNALFG